LTKSFSLESGALDKAFNSQYVDVAGYSKFQFIGAITNLEDIDFETHGEYTFDVKGILTVGESKRTTITSGTLIVNKDLTIQAYSDFAIKIEEENVKQINTLLKERLGSYLNMSSLGVSRDIDISVLFNYK
jgi:heptaprenylglyceryl phosphate synthase